MKRKNSPTQVPDETKTEADTGTENNQGQVAFHGVPLPEATQSWPKPRGIKSLPAQWIKTEAEYRAYFEGVVNTDGEEALALIYNDTPRSAGSAATKWFCPGLPMHTSGHHIEHDGKKLHGFYVPARAALKAAELQLVRFKKEDESGK